MFELYQIPCSCTYVAQLYVSDARKKEKNRTDFTYGIKIK